jgi:hypothetical protein
MATIDVHSLSSTLPNLAPCSINMPLPFPCLLALQPAPRYDTPASSSSSSSNSWGLFLTQDAVEGQVLYKGSYQVVDGEDRGGLGRREGGRHNHHHICFLFRPRVSVASSEPKTGKRRLSLGLSDRRSSSSPQNPTNRCLLPLPLLPPH